MKLAWSFGILCAVVVHAGVLLFGGLLFPHKESTGSMQVVDLISDDDTAKEKDKPAEPKPETKEELKSEEEQAPDAEELIRSIEVSAAAAAPELEAVSLGAIDAALNGQGGGGDFADALSFSSGGRIGGTGKAGTTDEKLDQGLSMAEIDQKPRVVFQIGAAFPSEMRSKKVDGVVTLIFVVDASGKVTNPRVENSTHPAFEKPALEALKQWKFEPAVKGGQRVACKMRETIRFQRS